MTHDKVSAMEKLCYEAQLKVEEAGKILCPETGKAAGYVRNKLSWAIAVIEDLIHNCYVLRDPVTPPAENTEEMPDEGEEAK